MNKTLTISIAAYNCNDFLPDALESLVSIGTMSELDIIIVDDGSTDSTFEIASAYEKRYPESIRFIHKENGGWGSVFNITSRMAKGKYYKILDADDRFDQKGLIALLNNLRITDSDVVLTDYWLITPRKEKVVRVSSARRAGKYKADAFSLPANNIGHWTITYKTSILQESALFLPSHLFYLDSDYSLFPWEKVETIEYYPIPVYCYRVGHGDYQSTSKSNTIMTIDARLEHNKEIMLWAENYDGKLDYIREKGALIYRGGVYACLVDSISMKNYQKMIAYRDYSRQITPTLYKEASRMPGKLFRFIRWTGYKGYWLLKPIQMMTSLYS